MILLTFYHWFDHNHGQNQLAEVEGFDYDVPLLLIYWFPQSETPSTVISLASSIVVPLDKPDPTKWNAYQWSISSLIDETQDTRTFTAPHRGRNEWVKVMNDAIAATFWSISSVSRCLQSRRVPTLQCNRWSVTFYRRFLFILTNILSLLLMVSKLLPHIVESVPVMKMRFFSFVFFCLV
jgi:hypothetical protein